MPGKIKKLPEKVINKIAAGEVIKDASAVVKEMVENSIDAKATLVTVNLRNGGLALIEVIDNGSGIEYNDFELLCERHATSKIGNADDLRTVSSFGFRGEALASVSFVATLTVTSKIKSNDFAYKAVFSDGVILPNEEGETQPEPVPGQDGTSMVVENLFKNIKLRQTGLSQAEEFNKSLKLITKLAIHHYALSFILKKDGRAELTSMNVARKNRDKFDIRKDLIQKFYGKTISEGLLQHQIEMKVNHTEIDMVFTKPDKKIKGKTLILFINERLVESDCIRKAITSAYAETVNAIHDLNAEFFCYVNLQVKKEYVDVNVNPTKKEVHFLNEQVISDKIRDDLKDILKNQINVKVYKGPELQQLTFDISSTPTPSDNGKGSAYKPYDKNLVRTDPKSQTLDRFVTQSSVQSGLKVISFDPSNKTSKVSSTGFPQPNFEIEEMKSEDKEKNDNSHILDNALLTYLKNCDKDETKFFQELVYVGCISSNHIFCQYGQKLLFANTVPLCLEAFYQICLKNFGNFEPQSVDEDVNISDLIRKAIKDDEENIQSMNNDDIESLIGKAITKFQSIQKFLEQNLNLSVINDSLITLPKILGSIHIKSSDYGTFILRLLTEVDYDDKPSIPSKISEILAFHLAYSLQEDEKPDYDEKDKKKYDTIFGSHLFPLIKSQLQFPTGIRDQFFVQLLKLEDVYKIFERC